MKKIVVYSVLAIILGFLVGYLVFHDGNKKQALQEDKMEETAEELWTCSMHPHILQNEPGNCPLCGMELIPASIDESDISADSFRMTKKAMALANIETSIVGTTSSEAGSLNLSGKIRPNEEAESVQASYFAGRIEELFVNTTGEYVRKGQRLATIYSPELVSAQQELLTAAAIKESQPALYNAVRNKLKLWKLSDEQINAIEMSESVKEYFPVFATVSGTVTAKMTQAGDYVKQGQPIYKIVDLSTLWAEFDAYENQLGVLKKGQTIRIFSRAYPGEQFDARISFIDPILNTATRTVIVRAVLKNDKMQLKPGMFVEGMVTGSIAESEEAIKVPASAVMWTGKRSVVYVKTNPIEPVFEMREISLGIATGDTYTILDGLSPGEEIVTKGTFTVDASAQLQGKKSMMNKEGERTTTGHEGHINMPVEQSSGKIQTGDHDHDESAMNIPSEFKHHMNTLIGDYMAIKDALVTDNLEKAKSSLGNFKNTLQIMDQVRFEANKTRSVWEEMQDQLLIAVDKLLQGKDMAMLRKEFNKFSNTMRGGIEYFGADRTIFNQYCPMANKNDGGYWLSYDKEIRNPYFGNSMLNCGEVVTTLQ